jgi:hypothetical protein
MLIFDNEIENINTTQQKTVKHKIRTTSVYYVTLMRAEAKE